MTQDEQAVTATDGSDDAVRDLDTIAKDLEQTRAELVDTIDRIVDRVSPKRAVSRWAQSASAEVEAVKNGEITPAALKAAAVAASVVALATVVLLRRRRR